MSADAEIAVALLDPEAARDVAKLFVESAGDGGAVGWSEAGIRHALGAGGCGFVASAADGAIAGAILFLAAGDDMEVANVVVAPTARRQGVATRLIAAGVAAAGARAARRILLEVGVDNGAAAALYRRRGFVAIGRRPNYYRRAAGLVDAEVMALELDPKFKPFR